MSNNNYVQQPPRLSNQGNQQNYARDSNHSGGGDHFVGMNQRQSNVSYQGRDGNMGNFNKNPNPGMVSNGNNPLMFNYSKQSQYN